MTHQISNPLSKERKSCHLYLSEQEQQTLQYALSYLAANRSEFLEAMEEVDPLGKVPDILDWDGIDCLRVRLSYPLEANAHILAVSECQHCGLPIGNFEGGCWIDETGGDACGLASAEAGHNVVHVPVTPLSKIGPCIP